MPEPDSTKPAVALVLGAKVLPGGVASPALQRRAGHAVTLWQSGRVQRIVASGAERWHPPSEAQAIADLCRAGGVPDHALTLEEAATSTEENLRFSRDFLHGAGEVLIVTDAFHAPRVRLLARRMGMQVSLSCPPSPRHRLSHLRTYGREAVSFLWCWISGKGRS